MENEVGVSVTAPSDISEQIPSVMKFRTRLPAVPDTYDMSHIKPTDV